MSWKGEMVMFSNHLWLKKINNLKNQQWCLQRSWAAGIAWGFLLLFPVALCGLLQSLAVTRMGGDIRKTDHLCTFMNAFTSLLKSVELEEKQCERLIIKYFQTSTKF